MLTCVYHPIDDFRVVEQDEAEDLMATGVWFDSPAKAQAYRSKVEDDINKETKDAKAKADKAKAELAKGKLKEQSNERK